MVHRANNDVEQASSNSSYEEIEYQRLLNTSNEETSSGFHDEEE